MQQPFAPPGHFYSPIPDVDEARVAVERSQRPEAAVPGIDLSDERVRNHWTWLGPHLKDIPLPDVENEKFRYYYVNDQFSYGDAATYWAFLAAQRPQRIFEIGSGFSSALALDARDTMNLNTHMTFVEPYPDRLEMLLRPNDRASVQIVKEKVQNLDPALVEDLAAGDLLFIDSSHVLKTGSDVAFELFELLPRLAPGVWVAIHDMFWPFEYPEQWVVNDVRAWNELYAVRAFLAFNSRFRIEFFNHYFGLRFPDLAAACPEFCKNFGGLLWLRVTGET